MLASNAGLFRGVIFQPSPQMPVYQRKTFLSASWPITLYLPNSGGLTLNAESFSCKRSQDK